MDVPILAASPSTGFAGESATWNIVGERVALGPMQRNLLPKYHQWRNDFQNQRTLSGWAKPLTLEQRIEWFERTVLSDQNAYFTIFNRGDGNPIGITGLLDIDHFDGTAEFYIQIGEVTAQGKGYGSEVTNLMLDYAFTAIGLHNGMLRVYAYNERGISAYEKAGFVEFGRRAESRRMANKRWDIVFMQCLATNFHSSHLHRVFAPDSQSPRVSARMDAAEPPDESVL